ncbi:unnamed protein product [Mytilus coruscus]|uniref:Uncharacterized protein n=1 Tax=Mytilus coruscus TaxID=42192 RepID=A0A6J8BGS8_MYTCO|nr:unnamed protein product [Mytilus coruscus]
MSVEKFVLDIHEHKCPFGIRDENEIEDIESAVKDAIKNICEYLASKDPRLLMSDLLPTGGYYEETKIENPNEFDYMVVCDIVSLETEFKMTSSCPGCVTLSPHHRDRWEEFCSGETFCFSPTKQLNDPEEITSFNNYFEFVQNCAYEEVEKCISKTTGNLYLVGAGWKSLSVSWDSFSNETLKNNPDFGLIDIDMMPCIRIPEEKMNEILKAVPPVLHNKNVWEHSMVGTDAEIDRFYKAQAGLADLVIGILLHISEINIQEYSLQSCLNIFEKLKKYLGKLTDGDIVFTQVEKKMRTFLRKRKGSGHNRCSAL